MGRFPSRPPSTLLLLLVLVLLSVQSLVPASGLAASDTLSKKASAACMSAAPSSLQKSEKESLCSQASPDFPTAPATCAKRLLKADSSYPRAPLTSFCSRAISESPAKCVDSLLQAPHSSALASALALLGGIEGAQEICQDVGGAGAAVDPTMCLNKLSPKLLKHLSQAPGVPNTKALLIGICGSAASSPGSADCLSALLPSNLFFPTRSTSHSTSSSNQHQFPAPLDVPALLSICLHANDSYPATSCALNPNNKLPIHATTLNPNSLTSEDVGILCTTFPSADFPPRPNYASLSSFSSSSSLPVVSRPVVSTPIDCYKRCTTPGQPELSPQDCAQLCAGETNSAAAECKAGLSPKAVDKLVKGAVKGVSSSTENIVKLCRSAPPNASEKKGPAMCANAVLSYLTVGYDASLEIRTLCHAAKDDAPATCYRDSSAVLRGGGGGSCGGGSAAQKGVKSSEKDLGEPSSSAMAMACGEAPNAAAVVACLKAAPYDMCRDEKAELCRGAGSAAPGECAELLLQGIKSSGIRAGSAGANVDTEVKVVELCRGAKGEGSKSLQVPLCVLQSQQALGLELAKKLCEGDTVGFVQAEAETTTGRSSSSSSSAAASAARKSNDSALKRSAVATCALSAISGSSSHQIQPHLAVALCRSLTSPLERHISGPVHCASDAAIPFGFTPSDTLALCKGALDAMPARCAKRVAAVPVFGNSGKSRGGVGGAGLSNALKGRLCNGAESVAPALCMEVLFGGSGGEAGRLSLEDAVRLCTGAVDVTPAYCYLNPAGLHTNKQQGANARKNTDGDSDDTAKRAQTIESCRRASSVPTAVTVRTISFKGEQLLPGSPIDVKVDVLDQFKQPRTWDNETLVFAKLDLPRGVQSTAKLEAGGARRSEGGVAHFANVSVTHEGNFTLSFYVSASATEGGEGRRSEGAAVVHLRVGQDPTEAKLAGVCAGLFESFTCLKSEPSRQNQMESIAMIPYPASVRFLPCIDILEEAGFVVNESWGGGLWLWSLSTVGLLGSGVGVATEDMNYWDRLGVEVGASKSVRRKAYFKKSLEWHPDRWVQYPHYQEKASVIFELISEAYSKLNECYGDSEVQGSSKAC